ncbi:MAG: O-antigen ligase family protein [Phycisphaeraceae bacterium]|nr:O-antigen ligase family protein [Phycisphaeraceae bacterium]
MKHLLVLTIAVMVSVVGSFYSPFWGVFVYYGFAVLRPQYLWAWSLPVEWRWSLIAAGAAILGSFLALPRLIATIKMSWTALLTAIFGLLLLISYLLAHNPDLSTWYATETAKILVMVLLGCLLINQLWQVRLLSAMVLCCIGYIAYEVNSLYLIDGRLDIYHYGYGGLDNNGAGLMLAMGVPFAYVYGLSATRRPVRWLCWLLGIAMIHGTMMSYSRGAMVAGLVGVVWVLAFHRSRFQALVITMCLCAIVPALAGREITEEFKSAQNYAEDPSAQSRFNSWSAAWEIALDNPLFGQGIRNSQLYVFQYGADKVGRTIHNQYLQIAADSGIPAMLVYISLLVVALGNYRQTFHFCLLWLQDHPPNPDSLLEPDSLATSRAEIYQLSLMCNAATGSLLIFAVGSVFISLELFEFPWVLIVMASSLPILARQRVAEFHAAHAAAKSAAKTPKKDRSKSATLPRFPTPANPRGLAHP